MGHLNDLKKARTTFDFDAWLDQDPERVRSSRLLIIYETTKRGWANYESYDDLRLLPAVADRRHWGGRLAGMPFEEFLSAPARPLAWLGRLTLSNAFSLKTICDGPKTWRAAAWKEIEPAEDRSEVHAAPAAVASWLHERTNSDLLVHGLDTEGSRSHADAPDGGHEIRLHESVVPFVDDLWLMEGLFATDQGRLWDRIREFLSGVREEVEKLVGHDPTECRLSNSAKPGWQATVESIRRWLETLKSASGQEWSISRSDSIEVGRPEVDPTNVDAPAGLESSRHSTLTQPEGSGEPLPASSTRVILVIDDHYDVNRLNDKSKIPGAVEAAIGRMPPICNLGLDIEKAPSPPPAEKDLLVFSYDYPKARKWLQRFPELELHVVLLDQFFTREGVEFVPEHVESLGDSTFSQREQGFEIARSISEQYRSARPAVYVFTGARDAREVSLAQTLRSQGVVEDYQDKPQEFARGNHRFDQLVRFLRWSLDPLAALQSSLQPESTSGVFWNFLKDNVTWNWRRDSRWILELVRNTAAHRHHGLLSFNVWGDRLQKQVPTRLKRDWGDNDLWVHLLGRTFEECEPWHPWNPHDARAHVVGRLRYYRVTSSRHSPREGRHRIVVILDPRFVPDLDLQAQRKELSRLPSFAGFSSTSSPASRFFRIPLPARAPGSGQPWLLGTWYDIDAAADWVPLLCYRQEALDHGNLRDALGWVVRAFRDDRGKEPARDVPRGWGFLIEGVLIQRPDESLPMGAGAWYSPTFPIVTLAWHPVMGVKRPLSSQVLDRLEPDHVFWPDLVTYWFAWGRLPDEVIDPVRLKRESADVGKLVEAGQELVPYDMEKWWIKPPIQRQAAETTLSSRYSPWGDTAPPVAHPMSRQGWTDHAASRGRPEVRFRGRSGGLRVAMWGGSQPAGCRRRRGPVTVRAAAVRWTSSPGESQSHQGGRATRAAADRQL